MEAAGAAESHGDSGAYGGVRSIFYYNAHVEVGQTVDLNIFEPRYRIMVKRVTEEPTRNRELIFLPNFRDYVAASGDIGMLARVERCYPIPSSSDDPDELPRAEIRLKFQARVMVLWHWMEPGTAGLHECTFRCLQLAPKRQLLEPLRDAMYISAASRYTVRTQRGFLNVHSSPDSPDNLDNVVGQLREQEEIVALEHRPGWVRHERGWSVSRIRFDNWLWLVPVEPQMLHPEAVLIESSQATNYSHLVMHAPSVEATQKARRAYEQISPGCGAHVLAMRVPLVSETVAVSIVLDRLAGIHVRDALPSLLDGGSDTGSEQLWTRTVAAADVAGQLLLGVEVLVACGAPCGLYITAVEFARGHKDDAAQHAPLAQCLKSEGWGATTPFDHFSPTSLSQYMESQYNYEHQILHQCPFPHDEVPAESIVAHAASIHLSTDLDPRTHAVVPPNYALVGREAADAIALKLLKRVNWCRFRVCFIGQREAGCVLALLNPEAMRLVLSQLLLDD